MKPRRSSLALLLAAATSTVLGFADPLVAAEKGTSWELTPYRILLLIAAEPAASAPRLLADDLAASLPARAAAVVGGSWQLEAAVVPAELRQALIDGLGNVTADRLPAEASTHDKVILLTLAGTDTGMRIQARELDVPSGLWNSVVTREVAQPEQVAGAAWQTVLVAFAPVARIDAVEKGTATLRLRAGAIARRDRGLAALPSGTVLRPVLVTLDEAGTPQAKSAQLIDWTLLTVTSSGGASATCRVDTGLAGEPIPGYHPRRMRLAVGVSPSAGSTRLALVSRSSGAAPLEGIEVLAADPAAGADARGQSLGLSDLAGVVVVPPGSAAMRMLDIRQGAQTLARVPIVPGLDAEIRLALADNRERLAIEAALTEAEDALVDLAARRQALAARIKLARKAGEANADALLPKLKALAGVESQQAPLSRAEKAIQSADPAAQALLQPKLEALRKVAQSLASQSPTALLDEPKPAEAKPAEAKSAEAKPTEAKAGEAKAAETKK